MCKLERGSGKMKVQAVVFDVGETLIDETRSWGAWADALNIPRFTLFGVLGSVIAQGKHHREALRMFADEPTLERLRPIYHFDTADLYPDVLPCLNQLKAQKMLVGIAGNQPQKAESLLQQMDWSIDLIASSDTWGVEKPSSAFFERIGLELNLPLEEIAYVGDRLDNDVLPALEAGMVSMFLKRGPWGYWHAQNPEGERAHIRLDSLESLSERLFLL